MSTIDRRGFLATLLAASVAPAYVKASSLMPILVPKKELILPPQGLEISINSLTPFQTSTFSCMMKEGKSEWKRVECVLTADVYGNAKARVELGTTESHIWGAQVEKVSTKNSVFMEAFGSEGGIKVVPSMDYGPPEHYKTTWFDESVPKIGLDEVHNFMPKETLRILKSIV